MRLRFPVATIVVDLARHRHILVGDAALRMRDQRESHRPPTDVDIRMVILLPRPARRRGARRRYRRGTAGNLIDAAQRAVGALPAVEVGQCGVHLFVR